MFSVPIRAADRETFEQWCTPFPEDLETEFVYEFTRVELNTRTADAGLPGKPDIVFKGRRLAIFIDGDFWHGVQWKRRGLLSLDEQFERAASRNYWTAKIRRNMDRDSRVTHELLIDGWTVLRFWESAIYKDLEKCVDTVSNVLASDAPPTACAQLPQRTVADFFAGIGLHRYAFERHGWGIVYANDIDSAKQEMYQAHFQDAESHYRVKDVHEVDPDEVPTVTLATASFPCNDLSLAGPRSGLAGPQSSALWGFVRTIEGMGNRRPPLVLLENVVGFLTSRKGRDFEIVLRALNALGYAVDSFILDAKHFVPQSRRRIFVIGVLRDGDSEQQSCAPRSCQSTVRSEALINFMSRHSDIDWEIRQLPEPPQRSLDLPDIVEDLPDDAVEWWSPERADYLLNQMSPKHRTVAEHLIQQPRVSYATAFRRVRNGRSMAELRADGMAGCLRTPRGGSARQILFRGGHGRHAARLLTPRECARLMGADDYRVTVSLNQALFGFGDAVCVPVMEWIARYYLNPLITELTRNRPLRVGHEGARP